MHWVVLKVLAHAHRFILYANRISYLYLILKVSVQALILLQEAVLQILLELLRKVIAKLWHLVWIHLFHGRQHPHHLLLVHVIRIVYKLSSIWKDLLLLLLLLHTGTIDHWLEIALGVLLDQSVGFWLLILVAVSLAISYLILVAVNAHILLVLIHIQIWVIHISPLLSLK